MSNHLYCCVFDLILSECHRAVVPREPDHLLRSPQLVRQQVGEGSKGLAHGQNETALLNIKGVPGHLIVTQETLIVEPGGYQGGKHRVKDLVIISWFFEPEKYWMFSFSSLLFSLKSPYFSTY